MTKKRYDITDGSNIIGFLVIEAPSNLESTAQIIPSTFGSDIAIVALPTFITFGGTLLACHWLNAPAWPAPALTVIVGVGLSTLKMFWDRVIDSEQKEDDPTPGPVIRLESVSEDGKHWILGELDQSLTMVDLQTVACAIVFKDANWSRPSLVKAGLSQGKYHKLTKGLIRLGYLTPLPNNANGVELSPRGRALMRKLSPPSF